MRYGFLLAVIACAALAGAQDDASPRAAAAASMEENWGIRIEALRSTAAGYMLDFRTRVTNAEKARPLFSRNAEPEVIDEATGARFRVPRPPKVGQLRFSGEPGRRPCLHDAIRKPGTVHKAGQESDDRDRRFQGGAPDRRVT